MPCLPQTQAGQVAQKGRVHPDAKGQTLYDKMDVCHEYHETG